MRVLQKEAKMRSVVHRTATRKYSSTTLRNEEALDFGSHLPNQPLVIHEDV